MFVMAFVLSWFVHGVLLHGDYAQMLELDAAAGKTHIRCCPGMVLAHALFGVAFAWIYVQGRERQALAGARHPLRHRDCGR